MTYENFLSNGELLTFGIVYHRPTMYVTDANTVDIGYLSYD